MKHPNFDNLYTLTNPFTWIVIFLVNLGVAYVVVGILNLIIPLF